MSDGNKRVVVKCAELVHHCAILNDKTIGYFLRIGKAHHKKWGLTPGMSIDALIEKDSSEYQFEMPKPLEAVLDSDEEAMRFWIAITPGKQRSLLHQIGKIKSLDLQIEKSLLLAERLKMGIKDPVVLLRPN